MIYWNVLSVNDATVENVLRMNNNVFVQQLECAIYAGIHDAITNQSSRVGRYKHWTGLLD